MFDYFMDDNQLLVKSIYANENCSAGCRHCFSQNMPDGLVMPLEMFRDIIGRDDILFNREEYAGHLLSCGEPLENPHLFEVVKGFLAKGARPAFVTGGWEPEARLQNENFEKLAGLSPEEKQKVTFGVSFHQFMVPKGEWFDMKREGELAESFKRYLKRMAHTFDSIVNSGFRIRAIIVAYDPKGNEVETRGVLGAVLRTVNSRYNKGIDLLSMAANGMLPIDGRKIVGPTREKGLSNFRSGEGCRVLNWGEGTRVFSINASGDAVPSCCTPESARIRFLGSVLGQNPRDIHEKMGILMREVREAGAGKRKEDCCKICLRVDRKLMKS